ncbi:hypothetical protein BT69DRAFT_327198 [Atractiella rhizophila]|nr:hypothetical protein BT69DRAFT_327198 [Atractiella rhizophila]
MCWCELECDCRSRTIAAFRNRCFRVHIIWTISRLVSHIQCGERDILRVHKAVLTSASSVNTTVLVGAITGVVVALAVCIGEILFFRRRRHKKKRSSMGSGPQKEKGTKVAISYPKRGHPSWIRPLNDQSVFIFIREARCIAVKAAAAFTSYVLRRSWPYNLKNLSKLR